MVDIDFANEHLDRVTDATVRIIRVALGDSNGNNNNNHKNALKFPAHDELGTCRTSLVSPKQSVLSILVWPIANAAFMTIT